MIRSSSFLTRGECKLTGQTWAWCGNGQRCERRAISHSLSAFYSLTSRQCNLPPCTCMLCRAERLKCMFLEGGGGGGKRFVLSEERSVGYLPITGVLDKDLSICTTTNLYGISLQPGSTILCHGGMAWQHSLCYKHISMVGETLCESVKSAIYVHTAKL